MHCFNPALKGIIVAFSRISRLYISLILLLIFTVAFAKNECLEHVDKHIYRTRVDRGAPYYYVLDLSSCLLRDDNMADILFILRQKPEIIDLNLANNFFTDEGIDQLAKARDVRLGLINASHNDLGDLGAAAFARVVGYETFHTTYLDLSENRISDEGIRELFTNTSWSTINLEKNNIGDEGVSLLASNYFITSFYLDHNNIGNQGALELSQAARRNGSIMTISVAWNHIKKEGLDALRKLKEERIIWNLNIDHNDE